MISFLTHCGVVTSSGIQDAGHHWFRYCQLFIWCQVITRTNVIFLSIAPKGTKFSATFFQNTNIFFQAIVFKCHLQNVSHFINAPMCLCDIHSKQIEWFTKLFQYCVCIIEYLMLILHIYFLLCSYISPQHRCIDPYQLSNSWVWIM